LPIAAFFDLLAEPGDEAAGGFLLVPAGAEPTMGLTG
jgi:hypothetical protein